MANEFVARRGIIAQSGGAKITGSLLVSGTIDATGYNIVAGSFTGSFSGSIGTSTTSSYVDWTNIDNKPTNLVSSSTQVQSFLPGGTVSASAQYPGWVTSSTQIDYNSIQNKLSGVVSSSQQIAPLLPNGTVSSSAQYPGWVTASSQIVVQNTTGIGALATTGSNTFVGNQVISGSLTTTADTMTFNGAMSVSGSLITTGSVANTNGGFTGSFTGSFKGDGSQLTGITAAGTVSASSQIDITQTTNYTTFSSSIATKNDLQDVSISALNNQTGSYATTGSNTFTGIQTISNTTNSTNYTDGALIVQGGVGITKDVNISGSLTVTGLLTAVSMSTQYVTSSQYVVGTSRVIVNDDDLVRFAGLSVVDSGSTAATGSLLWDSLNNHWIYEREDGGSYKSAIVIAGPKNYGSVGNEEELVVGRIPVATGGDHIDTNYVSSSLRIDFNTKETHVEAGLYITGSVTSSVGFKGDGSQLTGIVTTLGITGSDATKDTVDLKTSGLTFAGNNGITTTVANDTVTITAPLGTVSSSGQVKLLLPDGTVSSSAQYPGWVTSSAQIQLASITGTTFATADFTFPQKLTVSGVLSGSTSAYINNALYSGSVVTGIVGPVSNQVVATLPTANYDGVFFDYVVKDGTNYRTGTVMVVANGTNVEFTDTSTTDIGDTAQVSFAVDIVGGIIRLKFTNTSGTWTFKTVIRAL